MPVTALTVSSYQLNPPDLSQLMISCQMNYASAFLVLVLISAALYWYISGRKFYHGPIVEAQFEEEQSDSGIMAQEKLVEKDRDLVV
jgi:hypothetical protein